MIRKFLIGSVVCLGLLFGTTPHANATPHISLPVHPYIYIKVLQGANGQCEAWGLEYLGADIGFYWKDLGPVPCLQ